MWTNVLPGQRIPKAGVIFLRPIAQQLLVELVWFLLDLIKMHFKKQLVKQPIGNVQEMLNNIILLCCDMIVCLSLYVYWLVFSWTLLVHTVCCVGIMNTFIDIFSQNTIESNS